MKLKNIERLVRQTGYIQLLEGADNLWIGNGHVLAPLWDFERLSDEQVRALLNLTDKEQDKFMIQRIDQYAAELIDATADEELFGEPLISVTVREQAYTVYDAPSGAVWLRDAWLRPFLAEDKAARLALRQTETGPIVAVLRGFFLVGLIVPTMIDADLCRTLETLYVQSARRIEQDPELRAVKGGLK